MRGLAARLQIVDPMRQSAQLLGERAVEVGNGHARRAAARRACGRPCGSHLAFGLRRQPCLGDGAEDAASVTSRQVSLGGRGLVLAGSVGLGRGVEQRGDAGGGVGHCTWNLTGRPSWPREHHPLRWRWQPDVLSGFFGREELVLQFGPFQVKDDQAGP